MCKARQYSDQMICGRCGYQWDVNDDDPPICKTKTELGREKLKEVMSALSENKKNPTKK